MNAARSDAQKYGVAAVIVALVVLFIFFGLNRGASGANRPYIGAPDTSSMAGNGGTSGGMTK